MITSPNNLTSQLAGGMSAVYPANIHYAIIPAWSEFIFELANPQLPYSEGHHIQGRGTSLLTDNMVSPIVFLQYSIFYNSFARESIFGFDK